MAAKRGNLPIEELIGKQIWTLRKERKLSQEVLAEKSEINSSFLGCIERGQKCPTLRVLERIRAALEVTYAELFDFSKKSRSEEEIIKERFYHLLKELSDEDLSLLNDILETFLKRIPISNNSSAEA